MQIPQIDNEGSYSFWKNLILATFFFTLTPIVLATSLFSLVSLKKIAAQKETVFLSQELRSGAKVFASLPAKVPSVMGAATSADARVELIGQYLESYN